MPLFSASCLADRLTADINQSIASHGPLSLGHVAHVAWPNRGRTICIRSYTYAEGRSTTLIGMFTRWVFRSLDASGSGRSLRQTVQLINILLA